MARQERQKAAGKADPSTRILIDASMVQGGGGFTYVVNVIPRLLRMAPDLEFRVLIRSPRLAKALPAAPNLELTELPPVGLKGRLRHLGIGARRIAAAWKADLYFSVSESAPAWMPCPTIASFRNAVIVNQLGYRKEWPTNLRLSLLYALSVVASRRCEKILFVSEDSARWMGEAIGVPEQKRVVVHHGIDLAGWEDEPAVPRVHPRPYILSVSSMYRYKNFVGLIDAYTELAVNIPDVPDLVIVGDDPDPSYSAKMEEARLDTGMLSDRIHILGEVPYEEIQRYYAGAELFVFASYLETFGHPILEAMASGLPLVASDIPVFREIASDAALYADPFDAPAMARAMEQALRPPVASAMRKRGLERVREFSWDRSAERLIGLLRETAR